jgi:hypothetical protein
MIEAPFPVFCAYRLSHCRDLSSNMDDAELACLSKALFLFVQGAIPEPVDAWIITAQLIARESGSIDTQCLLNAFKNNKMRSVLKKKLGFDWEPLDKLIPASGESEKMRLKTYKISFPARKITDVFTCEGENCSNIIDCSVTTYNLLLYNIFQLLLDTLKNWLKSELGTVQLAQELVELAQELVGNVVTPANTTRSSNVGDGGGGLDGEGDEGGVVGDGGGCGSGDDADDDSDDDDDSSFKSCSSTSSCITKMGRPSRSIEALREEVKSLKRRNVLLESHLTKRNSAGTNLPIEGDVEDTASFTFNPFLHLGTLSGKSKQEEVGRLLVLFVTAVGKYLILICDNRLYSLS